MSSTKAYADALNAHPDIFPDLYICTADYCNTPLP